MAKTRGKTKIVQAQGKGREFFKKSGQGKSLILSKSVKSQGILFSCLQFISFFKPLKCICFWKR